MRESFDRPVDRRFTHSKKWHDYRGEDIISLMPQDSDFTIPAVVDKALRQRLSHGVLGTTLAPAQLRQLMVNRLKRHCHWLVEPEWIVFVPGDRCGLDLAVRSISPPGSLFLTPNIGDPFVNQAIIQGGGRVKPYRLAPQKNSHDYYLRWLPEWLPLQKKSTHARAVVLSNPQFPTGTVYHPEELACFLEIAQAQDLVVISDESSSDLLLDDKPHVPLASLNVQAQFRTITLMSPGKSYGLAGLHCGVAIIADSELRQRFVNTGLGSLAEGLNVFAYTGLQAAYRSADPWLAAQRDYLRGNRELLEYQINQLPGLSLQRIEGGTLAWVDASALGLADPRGYFKSHGVAVADGQDYGAAGFFLINFACSRSVLQLAMRRIAQAVSGYQKRR